MLLNKRVKSLKHVPVHCCTTFLSESGWVKRNEKSESVLPVDKVPDAGSQVALLLGEQGHRDDRLVRRVHRGRHVELTVGPELGAARRRERSVRLAQEPLFLLAVVQLFEGPFADESLVVPRGGAFTGVGHGDHEPVREECLGDDSIDLKN